MADQYLNIGWTAQRPPAMYADVPTQPWQIPADVDTVMVTAMVHSASGGRPTGWIQMTADQPLFYGTTEIVDNTFYGRIGMDGIASITIPATDATALTVPGGTFAYDMRFVLNHKTHRVGYGLALPKSNPIVDVSTLLPAAVDTGLSALGGNNYVVLGSTDPVPAGLPIGTLIIRSTS